MNKSKMQKKELRRRTRLKLLASQRSFLGGITSVVKCTRISVWTLCVRSTATE